MVARMAEAFFAEKNMAEKQGFSYMTEYLDWPKKRGRVDLCSLRSIWPPVGSIRSPDPTIRSILFEFGLFIRVAIYLTIFCIFRPNKAIQDIRPFRNSATSVIWPIGAWPIRIRPIPLLPSDTCLIGVLPNFYSILED